MAASVELRANPWSGPRDNRDSEYLIKGVDNYNEAYQAAVDNIPLVFPDTGLLRGTIRLQQVADQYWYATANYSPTGSSATAATRQPPPEAETGSLVRSCNFQAKAKKLKRFIEPLAVYELESLEPGAASENRISYYKRLKWMMDVSVSAAGGDIIHEHTFEPLAESRTLTYYVPNASVTDQYFDDIEDLVVNGCFNAGGWHNRQEGEMQIVRFSASERSADDWEFSFGFGFQRIESNYHINDDLILPTVRACDYYWTLYKKVYDKTSKRYEPVDRLAVLGRVWHLADFSAALGF